MIQSPKTILHECGTVSKVKVSQLQQLLELKLGCTIYTKLAAMFISVLAAQSHRNSYSCIMRAYSGEVLGCTC